MRKFGEDQSGHGMHSPISSISFCCANPNVLDAEARSDARSQEECKFDLYTQ
jgi:hypothetical protein